MNDVEFLSNMDALLKNDEIISKLVITFTWLYVYNSFFIIVNLINSIGGSDTKQFIKRVLPKLFSNKLATLLCSWTGQKNNFRLVDHQIMIAMKSMILHFFKRISI